MSDTSRRKFLAVTGAGAAAGDRGRHGGGAAAAEARRKPGSARPSRSWPTSRTTTAGELR